MSEISVLSIIAGEGSLPVEIAAACDDAGIPICIIGLKGFAKESDYAGRKVTMISMGELGKASKVMKAARTSHVVMAGGVDRPDLKRLKLDFEAMRMMPKLMKAAGRGDGALLNFVRDFVQDRGWEIISPAKLMDQLNVSEGDVGAGEPDEKDWADIKKGVVIARDLGRHDIAQGVVVADGFVLAIEAAEGTDEMLKRVAGLPVELRGTPEERAGVLVKVTKPVQDRNLDLPTIGPRTVELAAAAGLKGIAVEADGSLIVEREATIVRADELGIFIEGVDVAALEG